LEAEAKAKAAAEQPARAKVDEKPPRKPPPAAAPEPKAQRNFTDPESRILKTKDGYIQGYNAQAAVDAHAQIIVAHTLGNNGSDQNQFAPLLDAIKTNLGSNPHEVSADARTKATAKAKPSRSWAVTLIKNRGVLLGFVEAPDQKAAELGAAKAFTLSEWPRKRLLVRAFNLNATRNRQMCAPPLASIHLPQWLQLTSSKPPSLSRLIRRRTEAPNRSTKESAMMMARVIIECSHH
jgi:hypothetical protein